VSDAASSAAAPDAAGPAIDWAAAGRGGAAALLVVVPAGIALGLVDEHSSLKGLLFLVVLVGFGWGGAVGGKAAPAGRALTHGALAGVVAVAGYLVIGVGHSLIKGTAILAVALAFTALMGVSCGILGAELGDRRRRNRAAADDGASDGGTEP